MAGSRRSTGGSPSQKPWKPVDTQHQPFPTRPLERAESPYLVIGRQPNQGCWSAHRENSQCGAPGATNLPATRGGVHRGRRGGIARRRRFPEANAGPRNNGASQKGSLPRPSARAQREAARGSSRPAPHMHVQRADVAEVAAKRGLLHVMRVPARDRRSELCPSRCAVFPDATQASARRPRRARTRDFDRREPQPRQARGRPPRAATTIAAPTASTSSTTPRGSRRCRRSRGDRSSSGGGASPP
jgi:hypothetical protein